MKRNFVQVAQFLKQHFPDLDVQGENYAPSPIVSLMTKALSALQFLAILWIVVGGDNVLRYLGWAANRPLPGWYHKIQANAMMIGIVLFLLIPQYVNMFAVTGAFEIFLDGTQIWSKLEAGTFPTQEQLLDPIISAGIVDMKA